MIKALFVFPLLFFVAVACLVGGVFLLPLLAVLPIVLAVGAGVFAIGLVAALIGLAVRIVAAVAVGIGGIAFGLIGLVLLVAGGGVVLAIGIAAVHLLLPLFVIAAIVWLIAHFARPQPPAAQIPHQTH
ncbi:MAG TPA: hypothetical protein VF132_02955 [Rudaea sp.]